MPVTHEKGKYSSLYYFAGVHMRVFIAGLFLSTTILAIPVAFSSTAEAGWRHRYYGHHHRGETCWRTNRHTGAHFRIC